MNEIIVNRLLDDREIFKIVPLAMKRNWMTDSKYKFAYKCLPLNIANQYGFAVLSPADFTVDYWGGDDGNAVDVMVHSDDPQIKENIVSYLGEKTVTIHLDFCLQTPEGYSTYIRGIANETKDGIKYLDAIVETDWLPYTFSYSFVVTSPGIYEFKKNEPLFMFFPIERNTVENFTLRNQSIKTNDDFYKDFSEYANSRNKLTFDVKDGKVEGPHFQRFYQEGRGPFKKYLIKNHIKKMIFGKVSNKKEIL